MSIIVEAKIKKEIFKNDNFRIFSASPLKTYRDLELNNYYNFTIKGDLPFLSEGKEYTLELEHIEDKRYKGTYNVISVPSIEIKNLKDLTREESYDMLMNITTSDRLANNILDAYPNFIELMLTKGRDSFDLDKIKGVGESYIKFYERELNAKYKYYKLLQELKDYKLNINDCKNLYDIFSEDETIKYEIEKNPYYVLIEVLGKSFNYADKLILNLFPMLHDDKIRCEAIMLDVLKRNENDGNTRLNGNLLWEVCKEDYDAPNEWVKTIKDIAINSDLIYYDKESKDLAKMDTYLAELQISDFVKNKITNTTTLDIDWNKYKVVDGFELTEEQLKALENACKYGFSLLLGVAGGGKTSSLKGIIAMLEDNHLTYTLLAPTGSASLRMEQQTNRPASTIHKKCLKEGEIWTDFIIVDESSMVDLNTFSMLLSCICNSNARIILVGDNNQLLPVGKGCVFNDMINSKLIPNTMLTKVFRYDSNGALFVATNVRQGKQFLDDERVLHKDNRYLIGNNYEFIETPKEDILEEVKKQYNKLIDKGIKPNNILCLCPFNIGDCGNYVINNNIQAEVNAPKANENTFFREIGNRNIVFREGSRVINKKNNYNALPLASYEEIQNDKEGVLTAYDVEHTQIFNGQRGIVRTIDDKKMVIQFDEDLIVFDKLQAENLLLGYSISIHASQGSEADYVISVTNPSHKKMLNRNLLYVSSTRSKKKHIEIGSSSTFNEALLIDGNELRKTWLLEMLTKEEKDGNNNGN